jgi:hypothetical protein
MRRLAFLSAAAAIAFDTTPALAEDAFHVQLVSNPGLVYELATGGSPGTVLVRVRNGTSAAQSIYRWFPNEDNRFDVVPVDEDDRRPQRRPTPASYGKVISTGTSLAAGESSEVQVDLNKLFVLTPGHQYRVKAQTQLRFGPSDRYVATKLRSNETTIKD